MNTMNGFEATRSIRRGGMKTSLVCSRQITWGGLERVLAALVGLAAMTGCNEGHEGDRCVAALSHNDCASSDLICGQPTDCPETYCCSANSTNANCQPGCNGGALSILFASCSTATPSPLCPCINIINGINEGPLPASQYPSGTDCSCVAVPDPIACLAETADAGADAGSDAGTSSSDGSSDATGE
jgi:hypothetical protein